MEDKIFVCGEGDSIVLSTDQKNSFQPIGVLITGNCIHQGFRWKVTADVIGQIGNIQFPRIL